MKILIVGGTSSVGKALKPVLSQFAEVITAGRQNCDLLMDLEDPIKWISIPKGIDVAIHTASYFGEDLLKAEEVNVLGTLKLCQAAVKAGVNHLVYISSALAPLTRDSFYYSAYSLSKRHAEEVLEFYCKKHSLLLTILRPSQIYGDDDSFRKHQPFFYEIMDKAERGERIVFNGSHNPLRNFIHIDDIIEIVTKVVHNKVVGSYLCSFPKDTSLLQIAKEAYTSFNTKEEIFFNGRTPDIPDNVFEKGISLCFRVYNPPKISIEEGIKRIADYRRAR